MYMKTFPGPYVHQTTQNRILALFSALTVKGAVEGLAKEGGLISLSPGG